MGDLTQSVSLRYTWTQVI